MQSIYAPGELGVYQTLGIHIAPLGKLYMPVLVVEITSKGNAKDDRTHGLWAYAHAPVPSYLLIDRFDEHGPTATLFSEPQNGAYKHSERFPFGEQIKLPEPFGGVLDTAVFPG